MCTVALRRAKGKVILTKFYLSQWSLCKNWLRNYQFSSKDITTNTPNP